MEYHKIHVILILPQLFNMPISKILKIAFDVVLGTDRGHEVADMEGSRRRIDSQIMVIFLVSEIPVISLEPFFFHGVGPESQTLWINMDLLLIGELDLKSSSFC